jgi:excisionase family DNA binding protein
MSAEDDRPWTRGGNMEDREYLARPEAAMLLRWCEETLDKRLRSKEIDSVRVGRRILIPRESRDQFLERCRAEAEGKDKGGVE